MLRTWQALREAVTSVITHRLPAERFAEAFAATSSGSSGKVVLDWS